MSDRYECCLIEREDAVLYAQAVDLRYRVLREPWGIAWRDGELEGEVGTTLQIVACAGECVAGVMVLAPKEEGWVRMRQVAVEPALQRSGIGGLMVGFAEEVVRETLGGGRIFLHSRETAVPFYLRHGYVVEGEGFEEVGLEHFRMVKGGEV